MHYIGGQAVIEGVMLKARHSWAVAVRDPKGEIRVKTEPLKPPPRIFRLPFLRGTVVLFYSLALGLKALEFSANVSAEEELEKGGETLSRWAITGTIAFSFLLAIGLFILLPLYATKLLGMLFPTVEENRFMFNGVDGVVRVAVFLLYVWGIGLWSEIRRVFEYHGAEHKVIHAYEGGTDLVPGAIMPLSPLHARCGTSFLLIVMLISILVFSFIPHGWPFYGKFLARIVLMPVIAGLSYEFLKFSARMEHNPMMRWLIWPGLLLQRLTTREPDEGQVEVALRALDEVLGNDRLEEEKQVA